MTSSGLEKQLSVQEKVLKKLNEQNKNEEELSEKENLKLKRTKNLIETIKSYLSVLGDSSAEYNTYITSEELLNKLFAKTNAGKIKNIKSQIQSLDLLNKETKGTDEYRLVMNKLQQDLDKLVPNLGRMRIDIEAIQNFRQKDFNKGLFSDDFLENVRETSKNITIIVETLDPFAVTIQQTQQQMVSLTSAVVNAALAGDHMGRAFERALKGIIAQVLAAKLAFKLLSPFHRLTEGLNLPKFFGGIFQFHQGGQVQGYANGGMIPNYHSGGTADNVPAMLQEGEFVMRRSAVESIGIENLNRMNRTGQAGGVNINFSGNVLSDSFIEEEAIPKIKKAVRRGADLGIA